MPESPAPAQWERRERPAQLFRRFEFAAYGETRAFLDALARLSERDGYYPDISFGTTYVNVTIRPRAGDALAEADLAFARRASALAQAPAEGGG